MHELGFVPQPSNEHVTQRHARTVPLVSTPATALPACVRTAGTASRAPTTSTTARHTLATMVASAWTASTGACVSVCQASLDRTAASTSTSAPPPPAPSAAPVSMELQISLACAHRGALDSAASSWRPTVPPSRPQKLASGAATCGPTVQSGGTSVTLATAATALPPARTCGAAPRTVSAPVTQTTTLVSFTR